MVMAVPRDDITRNLDCKYEGEEQKIKSVMPPLISDEMLVKSFLLKNKYSCVFT